jgi:hypothetical protein
MTAGQPVEIQFELAGSDLERLVVVGSDLEYLIALPRDRLLTHTEVRLCAGVLRRLLIEASSSSFGTRLVLLRSVHRL